MGDKEWWRIVGNHREQIKLFEIKNGKKFFTLSRLDELFPLDNFYKNLLTEYDINKLVSFTKLGFLTEEECEKKIFGT